MEYPVSFFEIAITQISESEFKFIQDVAIAVRGSRAEEFEEFLETFDPSKFNHKEEQTEEGHKNNMALLNVKL